jgi:hypothetical protein
VPCGLALVGGVGFDVLLGGMLRVLFGVDRVGMRRVRVVGGFLGVSVLVMLGGFRVVPRSTFVMFCRLLVLSGCFFGHVLTRYWMLCRFSARHHASVSRPHARYVTGKLTEAPLMRDIVRKGPAIEVGGQ